MRPLSKVYHAPFCRECAISQTRGILNNMSDIFARLKEKCSQSFPLSDDPDPAVRAGADTAPKLDKILIVDDNVDLLEKLTFVLKNEYDVVTCSNPLNVMTVMDAQVMAVILDIKMDHKNGFEVYTDIKKQYDVPIIFFTAFQNEKEFSEIINEYRPFGYIVKGEDPARLLTQLSAAVRYAYRRQKEMALESSRLKTQFLANVSHELRTPIHFIQGICRYLLQHYPQTDARIHDLHEKLLASTERLYETLTNITDMSNIHHGSETLVYSTFNLRALLEEVLENAEKVNCNNCRFIVDIQVESSLFLNSDRDKLCRILNHLLSNAFKFTEGGEVQFSAARDDTALNFTISDTGCGIPRDYRDHLFETFSQAEDYLSRKHQGLGLGLAISKTYIEMLGGKIELTSEINKGTTVQFSLPV